MDRDFARPEDMGIPAMIRIWAALIGIRRNSPRAILNVGNTS